MGSYRNMMKAAEQHAKTNEELRSALERLNKGGKSKAWRVDNSDTEAVITSGQGAKSKAKQVDAPTVKNTAPEVAKAQRNPVKQAGRVSGEQLQASIQTTRQELEQIKEQERGKYGYGYSPEERRANAARRSSLESQMETLQNQSYEQERKARLWKLSGAALGNEDYTGTLARARSGELPLSGNLRLYRVANAIKNNSFYDETDPWIQTAKNMSQRQRDNFLYYAAKGDYKSAQTYLEDVARDVNRKQTEQTKEQVEQFAQEHPVLGAAAQIGAGFLTSPALLANAFQTAENAVTGKYVPTDYNSPAFWGVHVQNAAGEGVQTAARQAAENATGSETAGKAAEFLAGTGMSIGQNVAQAALLGPFALGAMGANAAATATTDALERGASPARALGAGSLQGAIEVVTEKIPLDNLFKLAKEGGPSVVKAAVSQILPEALGEGISQVAGTMADTAMMGDRSEYRQFVNALMEEGLGKDEAEKAAFLQFYVYDTLLSAAGGGLSGGVMGAGAALFNRAGAYARQQVKDEATAQAMGRATERVTEQSESARQDGAPVEGKEYLPRAGETMSGPEFLPRAGEVNAYTELERSGMEAGAGAETIQTAKRISKAIGKDIVFYNEGVTASGIQNGYYSPKDGKIHVNTQSKNPVAQIIAHELTHSVEMAESYGELAGMVLHHISQSADLEQLRRQKAELYTRNGVELGSQTEIDQEIVAEYVERYLLTDEQSITAITRENRTLGERILKWLNNLLAKLGVDSARERAFLTQARDIYARALRQAGEAQAKENIGEVKQRLNRDYEEGRISEEEFDDAFDVVLEEEGMAGKSMLERYSFGGENADGGNIQYSISETDDGRPVAVIDSDILRNIDTSEWDRTKKAQAKAAFNTKEEPSTTAAGKNAVSDIQESSSSKRVTEQGLPVKKKFSISEQDEQKEAEFLPRAGETMSGPEFLPRAGEQQNAGKLEDLDEGAKKRTEEIERILQVLDGQLERGEISEEMYEAAVKALESEGSRNLNEDERAETEKGPGRASQETGSQTAEKPNDVEIKNLPEKAARYLERTERKLLNKIGELLNVPRYAQQDYLKSIVRDISTEYLKTGTVSRQTIENLFERAYNEGIVVDSEYYDAYKHVKDYLRTKAITVNDQAGGDIPDFNQWRKSAFGTLRIVNSGGLGVDVAYMELNEMAPELFPGTITHPSDQLMRMYEVGKSIKRVEKSLDEVYGPDAEEFKQWAKRDFDTAVNEVLNELKQVKRFADERAQKEKTDSTLTQEQVTAMYGQLKDARRTYEKAAARNLLTQHDEIQVGRLLRGEIELEHLDPEKDNVKGISDVYEAKKEYERLTQSIREWNRSRKEKLRETADTFLETANDWKDKKAGILYSRETMERNIRDIVKDPELAEGIIKEYFTPVHEAQAESTRMKNQYRERVLEMKLSRKVEEGNLVSEAHAVQLLGEAQDCIRMLEQSRGRMEKRDGKTLPEWRGIVEKLWEENPKLERAKIEGAVAEFRAIYDELFQQMNETRVRNGYEPVNYRSGYFPHFQPGDNGILGQFGKVLGIDMDVSVLPTTINGLTHTFKPGIQWFGNAQERLGFNTAYDAVEGFDRYIEGVADVVHQTDNIQKLRALAEQIRYRTGEEGIRKQVDAVKADKTLSDTDKQNRIEKIYENGKYALSNFVVELEEYTNLLANKKSRADRNMEQAMGRRMYGIMKTVEGRVGANMVAVNPASWLTNFIPLTQGNAMLDKGMLLRGMWDTLKAYKSDDGFVDRSTFLTNRRGSDPIVKTWAQSASATLSMPMEYIDQFTADSLVRARYQQNVKKGMSEAAAMSEADSWVAGVMADRSKGSTPTLFNRSNPLTKVFTQFQLEVNNQLSYLFKDIPREAKEKGMAALVTAMVKFFVGAFLFNEVYEALVGRRPALDPIGILNDSVGDFTGYELPNLVEMGIGAAKGEAPSFQPEKKSPYEALAGLGENVAEELPFIGGVLGGGRVPMSSALPSIPTIFKAGMSEDMDPKRKGYTIGKELMKPLLYTAMPFGGGQLKKILQGAAAAIKGGSYSVNTKGEDVLQYPVYNDNPLELAGNLARATIFGKSSLPTAREWAESGFRSLGAKETEAYQAMTQLGVDQKAAYRMLTEMRGAEKMEEKREILKMTDISGEGKGTVYYTLMASDKERAAMDRLMDIDADMGKVTGALIKMKEAEALKGAAASNEKRSAILKSGLTERQKIALYQSLVSESKDEEIQAFRDAGLKFDFFLEAQNAYTKIDQQYSKSGTKAMEFSRWVGGKELTEEQEKTVKECFRYFTQTPVEATRYEQLAQAGLQEQDAHALASAMDALEPPEGKENVTDLQKWKVVTSSQLSQEDTLKALKAIMSESQYQKVKVGTSFGVDPAAYVEAKELLPRYDLDGNGRYKQAEITAAVRSMSQLTGKEKAALWQLLTGSSSGKSNPFDVNVGWNVARAVKAGGEKEQDYLPRAGESSEGMEFLPR